MPRRPPEGSAWSHPEPGGARSSRLVRRLLRVPLRWKILVAHAVLAGAVAAAAGLAGVRAGGALASLPALPVLVVFGALGFAVGGALVVLLVRWALLPLRGLEDAARRAQRGEPGVSAPVPSTTDGELERLIRVFNSMLETAERTRARLRGIAAWGLRAVEEERCALARRLREEIAQELATALVRLGAARHAPDPARREAELVEVRESLGRTLERVRRTARALRPPELEELDLESAIRARVRSLDAGAGVRPRVTGKPVGRLLDPETRLAAYRIVEEMVVASATAGFEVRAIETGAEREEPEGGGPRWGVLRVHVAGEERDPLDLFAWRERAAHRGGRLRSLPTDPAAGAGRVYELRMPLSVPAPDRPSSQGGPGLDPDGSPAADPAPGESGIRTRTS